MVVVRINMRVDKVVQLINVVYHANNRLIFATNLNIANVRHDKYAPTWIVANLDYDVSMCKPYDVQERIGVPRAQRTNVSNVPYTETCPRE